MKISKEKRDKISEQILAFLYSINPKPIFTSYIAKEMARDEEFIKEILNDLKNKKLIVEIKKNSKGIPYAKRSRWKLSDETYKFFKYRQISS